LLFFTSAGLKVCRFHAAKPVFRSDIVKASSPNSMFFPSKANMTNAAKKSPKNAFPIPPKSKQKSRPESVVDSERETK
jgi:hypothetical protein